MSVPIAIGFMWHMCARTIKVDCQIVTYVVLWLSSTGFRSKNYTMKEPRLVPLEHDAVLALSQILGIMLDQLLDGEDARGWSSEKILDLEARLMAPGENEGVLLGIDDVALLLQGMAYTEVMSQEFPWIDTVRWVTDFVTEELRKHWSEEEWRRM